MANPAPSFSQFMQQRTDAAAAYVRGDAGPVEALTTGQSPATFFGPDGGSVHDPDNVTASFADGASHFQPDGTSRLEILQSGVSEDIGFWTGFQHATVKLAPDGEPQQMKLRITEIFRLENGAWKLVHRHADMAKD
jgi:ketosteroid isomerase-like protein